MCERKGEKEMSKIHYEEGLK